MNKRITLLSLLAIMINISLSMALAKPPSYDELLQDLKEQLYSRQAALMNKRNYFAFITPILNQAEAQLKIPKYLKRNPNCPFVREYFYCLLDYNIFCFDNYIHNIPIEHIFDAYHYGQLYNAIAKIITEMTPDSDNVAQVVIEQEAKKTAYFLYNANVAYYEQLSWRMKSAVKIHLLMNG